MERPTVATAKSKADVFPLVLLGIALTAILWGYWNTLQDVAIFWDNPKYSHGYLIPLFTVVLLWLRREQSANGWTTTDSIGTGILGVGVAAAFGTAYIPDSAHLSGSAYSVIQLFAIAISVAGALVLVRPKIDFSHVEPSAVAAGTAMVVLATFARIYFTHVTKPVPEMYTLPIVLVGIFTLLGGWKICLWSAPALLFLVFMFPLLGPLDARTADLQRLATQSSTFALQTLGVPASYSGTTISVGEQQLNVVEACSGLRMLTIFVALSFAVALVIDRPIWERIVIIASSVPIALLVNMVRITVTGIMYEHFSAELAQKVFHDLAGYVMMPLALGLLFLEFQILSNLFVEDDEAISTF